MVNFDNLLVVGASNRNLGKTEFISRLIKRFHGQEIIAIKIKSIYPGDSIHHGKDLDPDIDYFIRRENAQTGLDDSKRFLAAGAKDVFYIKSNYQNIGEAIENVRSKYQDTQLFIAESNSVLGYCIPGGFIMICGPDQTIYKPSSLRFMDKADITINSDGRIFSLKPEELKITIEKNKWLLK